MRPDLPDALVVLGVVLMVAGVAVVYWPAALVLAGAALIAVALLVSHNPQPRR